MKRSEALTPLSHDHHQGLVVAQRLRRADGVDGPAADDFRRFWVEHGGRHFRVEEEVLLPFWRMLGNADAQHVARLAQEHLEIRALTLKVEAKEAELAELRGLGELLRAHIRYEERELFPLIEGDLDAAAQRRLGAAVQRAESA